MKRTARHYAPLYGSIALIALFATPGAAEPLAEPGDLIVSHTFRHDDGIVRESLFLIDPKTLAQEVIAPELREPVAFTPTGDVLALDASRTMVMIVDLETGVTSPFYTGHFPTGPFPNSGNPGYMLPLDDQTFLVHFHGGQGRTQSLWKFDAATQSSTLVADRFPGEVLVVNLLEIVRAGPNEIFMLLGDRSRPSDRTDQIVRVSLETLEREIVTQAPSPGEEGLLVDARAMALADDGSLLVSIGDEGGSSSPADGIVRVDPATGEEEWVIQQQPVGDHLGIGAQDKVYVDLNPSASGLAPVSARGPVEFDVQTGTRRILAPNLFSLRGIHVVPGEPAPPACRDGLDNDGDGRRDWPRDLGCTSPDDGTEESDCADGIDNDGDGLVDFGEDDGCRDDGPFSFENPACSDGIDNDGDGYFDDQDPECLSPSDNTEHWTPRFGRREPRPRCGLIGIEPLLLALLPNVRRRWRRRAAARAG